MGRGEKAEGEKGGPGGRKVERPKKRKGKGKIAGSNP